MTKGFKTAVAVAGGLAMTFAFGVVSPAAASTAPTEPPGSAAAPAELNNGENVTLKLLADNTQTTSLLTAGVTAAFSALHPNVTIDIEQRPGGTDGDNIVKTRLATGEMADVFFYNSGSLFQALNPTETLVDLTGDPMLDNVVDAFIPTVTPGRRGVRRAVRHRPRRRHPLQQLDLQGPGSVRFPRPGPTSRPTTRRSRPGSRRWSDLRDTWTSQLFVLADFYNVAGRSDLRRPVHRQQGQVRRHPRRPARLPAAAGGLRRGVVERGLRLGHVRGRLADARRRRGRPVPDADVRPSEIAATNPDAAKNIGFFAQPGADAAKNGVTLWMPRRPTSRPRPSTRTRPRSSWRSSPRPTARDAADRRRRTGRSVPDQGCDAARRRAAGRRATCRPTSTPATSRRRSSSSRRSRARRSSRSRSRSAPVCAAPRTAPRSTTRTSRSRPSSSDLPGW